MWEWFITNSVWILTFSTTMVFLPLFVRRLVQEAIKKAAPKKWLKALDESMRQIVWGVESIAMIILALALIAVIISKQGAAAVVTPETIQRWFLEHSVPMLTIILFSYLLFRVSRWAMPEIVERSVRVRGKGRHAREELAKRSQTLNSILTQTFGAVIIIVAIFMVLAEVGVNITPLLAGAGVVGIAIGFGAQSLFRDLLNGLFILLEDQYNKGDVVRVGGIGGQVEELNLRRTVLRDLDGIVHTIPNGEIKTASNYTKDWARVKLDIPVAYSEDLDRVTEVLNKVGKELAEDETFGRMIIVAPKVLRVDNFGDSGIEMRVLGETKPLMQWDVAGELRKRIKKAFDKEGIEIPGPHVKPYLGQSKAGGNLACRACSHPNIVGSKFCANCGASLSP